MLVPHNMYQFLVVKMIFVDSLFMDHLFIYISVRRLVLKLSELCRISYTIMLKTFGGRCRRFNIISACGISSSQSLKGKLLNTFAADLVTVITLYSSIMDSSWLLVEILVVVFFK